MTECIEYTKFRDKRGYGRRWWQGKMHFAHRVAWMQANGPIPEGMFVCHHCDNPPCINPEHLFLGTRQANMDDLKAKRLRRSAAADTGRLHIFIRGRELVGDVTWEIEHEQPLDHIRAQARGGHDLRAAGERACPGKKDGTHAPIRGRRSPLRGAS